MQDNIIQSAMQPFMKLAQANMELLTRFMSPETFSHAIANAQKQFQQGQGQGSATNLMQSNPFAELMQGLLGNYTEFMAEVSQSAMAVLGQSQALMVRGARDASDNVVDASEAASRRTRQSA